MIDETSTKIDEFRAIFEPPLISPTVTIDHQSLPDRFLAVREGKQIRQKLAVIKRTPVDRINRSFRTDLFRRSEVLLELRHWDPDAADQAVRLFDLPSTAMRRTNRR